MGKIKLYTYLDIGWVNSKSQKVAHIIFVPLDINSMSVVVLPKGVVAFRSYYFVYDFEIILFFFVTFEFSIIFSIFVLS